MLVVVVVVVSGAAVAETDVVAVAVVPYADAGKISVVGSAVDGISENILIQTTSIAD